MPAILYRSLVLLGLMMTPLTLLAADLTVSAAASLTNAFKDLVPLFEAKHPGHRLQLNFAASGALLQQIARGAPVDVFVSADQETMDQAQSKGLIDAGQRRNVVSNTLVVIVPAASVRMPRTLADLAQPAYQRIAMGLPDTVPVGRYTRSALEAAGLWKVIQPRMITAHNVRQALDYVARAEVEAGFVYATDAALMPDKVKRALSLTTPIFYPAAPVAGSAQPGLARRFLDFLGTPPAQAILARHGFLMP